MPPQGISNALSLNVSSPATQVWVVVVHSWDWGWQQRPWPSGTPRTSGAGPRTNGPLPGASHAVLHNPTVRNLLWTDRQRNCFPQKACQAERLLLRPVCVALSCVLYTENPNPDQKGALSRHTGRCPRLPGPQGTPGAPSSRLQCLEANKDTTFTRRTEQTLNQQRPRRDVPGACWH